MGEQKRGVNKICIINTLPDITFVNFINTPQLIPKHLEGLSRYRFYLEMTTKIKALINSLTESIPEI